MERLYGALRGAWHYKQTHAGRAAHANASASEQSALGVVAPVVGPAAAELLVPSKKQRQQAENYLCAGSRTASGPLLLPGVPTPPPGAKAGEKRQQPG